MKFHPFVLVPVAALVATAVSYPATAANDSAKTVRSATQTFQEFIGSGRISPQIVRNSQGIAIIPNVIQAGFFLGGQRGQGIMVVRNSDGSWSNPVIISVTGGSVGLQFGAKSSDIILAFQDKQSIRKVYNSDFRLGGNVSGTAGPVGAQAVYPTDSTGNIYAYSKSEGLFGGISLAGVKLGYDNDGTSRLYGRSVTPRQVFAGQVVTQPPVVTSLKSVLNRSVSYR